MYKRFIRWASDRLADDGIIGFVTNRAYIDSLQDDGFRKSISEEFSDIYVVDLGGNFQRSTKAGNIFGIRIGVAVAFFIRSMESSESGNIHYYAVNDEQSGAEKLTVLKKLDPGALMFEHVAPDIRANWLNQVNADFEKLMPLADRQTKFAKDVKQERAVFRLISAGVKTNRDEWVYDFDSPNLIAKARLFSDTYNSFIDESDESYNPIIKWSSTLRDVFQRRQRIVLDEGRLVRSLYRPFTVKHYFANTLMNDRLTRNHYEMFGEDLRQDNKVICVKGPAANYFSVLAVNKIVQEKFAGTNNGGTFCLPLYRYTPEGERVSNITDWGIRRINDHYREEWGKDFDKIYPDGIGAEDIFAYTYAVLHDPVYLYDYAKDLLREFPRLPLYHEFDIWARMGRELLDLHLGFESAEPYPLERVEKSPPQPQPFQIRETAAAAPYAAAAPPPMEGEGVGETVPRPRLRADKERGVIVLDDQTSLAGVPPDAWRYRLGSRSALEWVLDQYKEKKPRDPTIRERFDTYRFADHKEHVIDLLMRVCAVSVKTMDIVDGMAYWEDGYLVVYGDRDKHEWGMMGLSHWFSEPEDEEWLKSWLEM